MKDKIIYDSFEESVRGGVVLNLNMDKVKQTSIPIPPISEQSAIAHEVENLMQKCQSLEGEIGKSDRSTKMLMQVVLKEAFEG